MQSNELFNRLKVVELASVLAGPSVGQFFAELGAEVIKVENLKTNGDVTRTWKGKDENTGNISAYFSSVNWGKKSIAIDLSQQEGKSIVQKIISNADIVIASYKPGDAERLGVDYMTLSLLNPKLIYGQITGYGSDDDRVGYDAVVQAESGFMDLNGEKGGEPLKMPVALIDVLAAHHLKEGLLIALLNREANGKGDFVEVSLIQAAISSLANQAANYLVAKVLPQRQGSAHPNIAPYGESFYTRDGNRVLLAIGNNKQFAQLCEILSLDLPNDARFSSNASRVKNRSELNSLLEDAISGVDSLQFLNKCHELKIPAGLIQNLKQVFDLPYASDIMLAHDSLSGVRNFVCHFYKKDALSHIAPPPSFGQHSLQILVELIGFTHEEANSMLNKGIIG